MDLLPLEMLEEILNKLPFKDLLNACLVSKRWNVAAETNLLRRASLTITNEMTNQLADLRELRRNYDSVSLIGGSFEDWKELQPIMNVCISKFQPREIILRGILADHLNDFYQSYKSWFENTVNVSVLLDDRFMCYLAPGPANYTLNLPKAQSLYWYECLYDIGEKTITLNAPNLKTIIIDDSLDETNRLNIPNCIKVEELKCTFYTKMMHEVFDCNFPHLMKLELQLHCVDNVEFLNHLPNLKWLFLFAFYPEPKVNKLSNAAIESICRCQHLEVLKYELGNEMPGNCNINLAQVANSLSRLKLLDLRCSLLQNTNRALNFPSLNTLNLSDVGFSNQDETVQLNCPHLDTLSVSALDLSRIYATSQWALRKLKVTIGDLSLTLAVDTLLVPFLQRFNTVKVLEVHSDCYDAEKLCESFHSSNQLEIEKLTLRNIGVRMDCLEQFFKWKTLQELELEHCRFESGGQVKDVEFELWRRKNAELWSHSIDNHSAEEVTLVSAYQ